MTNLRKLIKQNNIKNSDLFNLLGISRVVFERKTGLHTDFKIEELEKIKDYFVQRGIIDNNYDIGNFLEEE